MVLNVMGHKHMAQAQPSVAVVGCGYWGKNIVRNFAELGELRAVCDPFPGNAEAMAKTFGVPAVTLDQMLDDGAVSGVAIAAPAPLHAEIANRCLSAGKHVLVEKPIALNLDDARRLIDVAARERRVLMVGHLLNYHPAFLKVADMVGGGEIGGVRRIYSNRLSLGKVRNDENVMWSFAPHDVSMILRLAGDRRPIHVDAFGAGYLRKHIADFAHLHMTFDGGLTAHVFTSWLHPFKEHKLVVVGETGMIVFDDTAAHDRKVALYRHVAEIKDGNPIIEKADPIYATFEASEPLRNECKTFVDAMAGKAAVKTDGEEGLRVLEVLSRADAAIAEKNRGA